MLKLDDTVLLIIDVQGKLAQLMDGKELLFKNIINLAKGAKVLNIPIIWTEQYPEGIGPTIPELAEVLTEISPLPKITFSCCQDDGFLAELKRIGRKNILISGIEAHICVYQTVTDLISQGYHTELVVDAVSSRNSVNKELGIDKMVMNGASITCVETALYELLGKAGTDEFKQILKIIK